MNFFYLCSITVMKGTNQSTKTPKIYFTKPSQKRSGIEKLRFGQNKNNQERKVSIILNRKTSLQSKKKTTYKPSLPITTIETTTRYTGKPSRIPPTIEISKWDNYKLTLQIFSILPTILFLFSIWFLHHDPCYRTRHSLLAIVLPLLPLYSLLMLGIFQIFILSFP